MGGINKDDVVLAVCRKNKIILFAWVIFFAILTSGIGLLALIPAYIVYKCSYLELTRTELIAYSGFATRKVTRIPLSKIQLIEYSWDWGTIGNKIRIVNAATSKLAEIKYKNMENASEFVELVNQQIAECDNHGIDLHNFPSNVALISKNNIASELQELKKLLADGVINEKEFEEAKNKILH